MGYYRITLEGTGMHHNNDPRDADAIARRFAGRLKEAGHDLREPRFELLDGPPGTGAKAAETFALDEPPPPIELGDED